jgi:U4/U6.U5 tri-snRNP-associated protein 1
LIDRISLPRNKNKMDEISLSVEETNKLRISLGLPILKEEQDNTIHVDLTKQNEKESLNEDDLKAAKMTADKVLKRKKTLGQGKQDSMQDFLKKVGKKAVNSNEKSTRSGSTKQYGQEDLQGIKIAHDLEDLPQQSILTLKDSIINGDDDEDELENISIKKPQKPKAYNVYDEYEREGLGLDKTILAKYDEDEDVGFVLGKGGVKLNTTKQQDLYEKVRALVFNIRSPRKVEYH